MIYDDKYKFAINVIFDHEGGLSDDKRDPGGITNFGITIPWLQSIDYKSNNSDGIIDREDILALTKEKAAKIYYEHMWIYQHYDKLEQTIIATKVFDMAVNMGEHRANKLLQESINNISKMNKINVDGFLGSKSINAANAIPQPILHEELKTISKNYYEKIIIDHPKMKWAEKDWLKRAAW